MNVQTASVRWVTLPRPSEGLLRYFIGGLFLIDDFFPIFGLFLLLFFFFLLSLVFFCRQEMAASITAPRSFDNQFPGSQDGCSSQIDSRAYNAAVKRQTKGKCRKQAFCASQWLHPQCPS